METPSSNRMVTRSQARSASSNNAGQNSKESEARSRQRKTVQQPLIDITNDSPIVGLTSGSLKTPLTSARKAGNARSKAAAAAMTPGSGEALLRGQVKNLLQMVEEETEVQKLPCRPFLGISKALIDSPLTLLAPANTPQVPGDQSGFDLPSPVVHDPIIIAQAVNAAFDGRKEESSEVKSPLPRSLMMEFLEKDELDSSECDSTMTILGSSVVADDDDDDDESVWSMQVNASAKDEDYDDDEVVYEDGDDDELCCGMSRLSVGLPEFTGKHIRFVYSSDGEDEAEIVRAEEVGSDQ